MPEPESELPNADDRSAEQIARERADQIAREDTHFVREVLLGSPQGRAWFFRYLEWCNIFAEAFAIGMGDLTAYNLGRQGAGKRLWLEAEGAAPNLVRRMMAEHQAELAAFAEDVKRANERFGVEEAPATREGSPDDQYPQIPRPELPPEPPKATD